MVLVNVFVCSVLLALVAATEVLQCPGRKIDGLSQSVQLSPCKKPVCLLKKGTNQHISISFTPEKELKDVKNRVSAEVFGVNLPFIGVDGKSICGKMETEDGQKASCPLQPGTKYVYKDAFLVENFYPSIKVQVQWSLQTDGLDILCFKVPARIG